MPFCVNCGNENPVDVRFCSKCGTEQIAIKSNCSSCGKELEVNEKFCSACGTPAGERAASKPKPESQPPPKPKAEKRTKEGRKIITGGPKPPTNKQASPPPTPVKPIQKKKKGCMGCLGKSLLGLLVLFIVGVVIIWNLPDDEENVLTDTNIPGIVDIEPGDVSHLPENREAAAAKAINVKTKGRLLEKQVQTDSINAIVEVSNDITLILPVGMFDGEEKLVVNELNTFNLPDGRTCSKVFDISLGELHEFDDFVEIQINPPAGFNAGKDIVQCYSKNGNILEQNLTFYDSDLKKVRSFTNHFSMFAFTFETFELVHDPMMKVSAESANLWGRLTSTAEVKLLGGYDATKVMQQQSDDYLAACWNTSLELYGLESAGLSFAENVLDIAELGDLNNIVGNIGFGLALVNSAMDAQRGKKDKAVLETLKNTYNFAATKFINTKALNIAFIGVFAIDYALTTFANEAWEGRRNLYRTVFDNFNYHQRIKEKKNLRWWKKQIYWRMEDAKDPSKFEEVVETLIQEYIQEFWDNDVERAITQAELQKHGWTYNGGYGEKLKTDLNPEFRIYILQYIQPLIERMQLNYLLKSRQLQQQKIREFGNVLNQEHQIRCLIELKKEEEAKQYEGAKIEFKVVRSIEKLWQGYLSKDAIFDMYCTKAGFISAGFPKSATLILDPSDEEKSDKYEAPVKLKSSGQQTTVIFTLEKLFPEGLWNTYQFEQTKEFSGKSKSECEKYVQNEVRNLSKIAKNTSGWSNPQFSVNYKTFIEEFKDGEFTRIAADEYKMVMPARIYQQFNDNADFNEKEGRSYTRMLKNEIYYKVLSYDQIVYASFEFFKSYDEKKGLNYEVVAYYIKGIRVKE